MAEPFSTASAVLSTLDIMLRAANKAHQLYQSWRDAPTQIQTLLDELDHFTLVVETAKRKQQSAQQYASATTAQQIALATAQQNIAAALQKRLQSSLELWNDLDAHAKECGQDMKKENVKRRRWSFSRRKTDGLRARLADERVWIIEILGLSRMFSSDTISQQLVTINTDVRTHQETTLTRLVQQSRSNAELRSAFDQVKPLLERLMVNLLGLSDTVSQQLVTINTNIRTGERTTSAHLVQQSRSSADILSTVCRVETLLHNRNRQRNDAAVTSSSTHGLIHGLHADMTARRAPKVAEEPKATSSDQSTSRSITPSKVTVVKQQTQISHNRNFVQLKITEGRRSPCNSSCKCSCHRTQRHWNLSTPWLLRHWFGLAYASKVAYADPASCTEKTCGNANTGFNSLEMGYAYPDWLSNISVHVFFITPMLGKPSAGLVLRRRVGYWTEDSIFRLADEGDAITMQALLEQKRIFLDDQDPDLGYTALQRAVGRGNFQIAKFLLQYGADPDISNDMGITARDEAIFYYFASYNKVDDKVREELQELFAVHAHSDAWGLSFLHKVVLGLAPIALEALDIRRSFRDQISAPDDHGRTPLHWAVIRGDFGATKYLIDSGANVNVRDVYHMTPLELASFSSDCFELFKLLLSAGADPQARDRVGEQPIHRACYAQRDPKSLRLLVDAGADVNAISHGTKFTTVHRAIQVDNADILEELIKLGADMHIVDDDGNTYISRAVRHNAHHCLSFILERNGIVDYRLKNRKGQSILHFAAKYAHCDILRLLGSFELVGLDCDARDTEGRTAFDCLPDDVSKERLEWFNWLLCRVCQNDQRAGLSRDSLVEVDDGDLADAKGINDVEEGDSSLLV